MSDCPRCGCELADGTGYAGVCGSCVAIENRATLQPPEAPVGEEPTKARIEAGVAFVMDESFGDGPPTVEKPKDPAKYGCMVDWETIDKVHRFQMQRKDAELQRLREQHAEALKLLDSARCSLEEASAFGHNMELDVEKWTRWHDGFKERETKGGER